ncbi:MAG: DUF47 family protein [Bdellovibrionales bacterium]|jgi:hypothetical protein
MKFKFPSLFPREKKFFEFMEKQADISFECATQLRIFIENSEDQNARAEIDRLRTASKKLTSEITFELCRSFITPFDREDIQDFSDFMYNVPKIVHRLKERILLHSLSVRESDFIRQADLIVEEATAMKKLVGLLVKGKGSASIIKCVNQLDELEHEGDIIHDKIMEVLFKSHNDLSAIVLRRDVCDMLEKAVDRFRDAAAVILQIVLKRS